ncbi:hypothetical protein Ddye_003703, partial [Dipteronia dyeriana]
MFSLSEIQPFFQQIQEKLLKFCTNSHFDLKHLRPLWKSPEFFIKLPFKVNEDINPTKAFHSGMSPSDIKMASEE